MKKTKKTLSILLSCVMLLSLLSVGVFAEDYIDANASYRHITLKPRRQAVNIPQPRCGLHTLRRLLGFRLQP